METAGEAIVFLANNLRVVVATPPFYGSFAVSPSDTVNRLIFDLGNRQWDIPALRTLLEKITRQNVRIDDFEVRHTFEHIGERVMLLNARHLTIRQSLIFLSITNVT